MTGENLRQVLQDNWMLMAALVAVLLVAAVMRGRGTTSVSAAGAGPSGDRPSPAAAAATPVGKPDRPSPQAVALETIARHQERIDADPKNPESPALLNAMGNLYRQKLGDYARAVQCYEILLQDYPEWDGRRATYVQLVSCYEKLEDRQSLRRVFRDMMKAFPPDSQEYLYAQERLSH